MRVADRGWRDCFENAIREATGKTFRAKLLIWMRFLR